MATRLLIDGYNVMKRTGAGSLVLPSDTEVARPYFLERLASYSREKGIRITVVFDAPGSISFNRLRERFRGVEVVYSARGETADEVIIEVLRKRQAGIILVSSDRALIDEAKKNNAAFITPDRLAAALEGGGETEEERRTEKKGNPRRLPKRLRRAKKTIGKI